MTAQNLARNGLESVGGHCTEEWRFSRARLGVRLTAKHVKPCRLGFRV